MWLRVNSYQHTVVLIFFQTSQTAPVLSLWLFLTNDWLRNPNHLFSLDELHDSEMFPIENINIWIQTRFSDIFSILRKCCEQRENSKIQRGERCKWHFICFCYVLLIAGLTNSRMSFRGMKTFCSVLIVFCLLLACSKISHRVMDFSCVLALICLAGCVWH